MLLSLLLTATLGAQAPPRPAGAVPPPQTTAVAIPTLLEASALADQGDLDAALRAFQQIASANPQDHEARLWIARLHLWMHHPDRAEPVYRSVLLENPSDVRAMLGLGTSLVALREYREGIEVLEEAEKAAPQNPEVLSALGRAHAASGREERSIGYLQRAATIAPNAENLMSLERVRAAHDHRLEVTGLSEDFNTAVSDTHGADVAVNVRLTDRFRLTGRGQWQRKFGRRDERAGIGFEWRLNPQTTFIGHGLFGPDNDVLPQNEVYAAIDHVRGPAAWTLGVRYFDFFGARASVLAPSVRWWVTERTTLDLRYALVVSDFPTPLASTTSHSVLARGSLLLWPRVTVMAAYAGGIENFDALSIDRIGDFRANTASAGVRVDLPSRTSLYAGYDHQWRQDDLRMRRFSISLSQRF